MKLGPENLEVGLGSAGTGEENGRKKKWSWGQIGGPVGDRLRVGELRDWTVGEGQE